MERPVDRDEDLKIRVSVPREVLLTVVTGNPKVLLVKPSGTGAGTELEQFNISGMNRICLATGRL